MKVCIAYDSKYGNGKKCVEHLHNIMTKKGHDVDIFNIRDTKPGSLPKSDLYIFSAPTHVGNVPFKMRGFLKNLNIKTKGAKYSLITTCMDTNNKALDKMTALIQPFGLVKAANGVKIKVDRVKGPLEAGYEKRLQIFADDVLKNQ